VHGLDILCQSGCDDRAFAERYLCGHRTRRRRRFHRGPDCWASWGCSLRVRYSGPMRLTDHSLVITMCLGQIGNLLPHVAVPAVMAEHLIPLWQLSATQAGMMASAFAFGYMLAVPFLTTLTDRIDARLILLVGSAATALATLAFGLFADGLWSA